MLRNSFLLLTFGFLSVTTAFAQLNDLPEKARASSPARLWRSLISSEIEEPSVVIEEGKTKKDIRSLRIDGFVRGLGRFRAVLDTLRRKSWDVDAEGGDPFILLQGDARFLSGRQKKNSFPAAATATRSNGFVNITLFLFGDNVRRSRKTALYQFNLRVDSKGKMTVLSYESAKWDGGENRALRSLHGHSEACVALHPDALPENNQGISQSVRSGDLQVQNTVRVLELVAHIDSEFSSQLGSNAVSEVATMLNAMETIYERDLGVTLDMTIVPSALSIATNDGQQILEEYRVIDHANDADLYHLVSGKSVGGLLGIAYVGVACNAPNFNSGVSYYTDTAETILTLAHEIGHNFNAGHDEETNNPPTLMFPSAASNLISEFSDISKNAIASYIASEGSCLETRDAESGEPEATPTPAATPTPSPEDPIDDGTDDEVDGSTQVDLFTFRFRRALFLGIETFTEFDFEGDVSVELLYSRRRNSTSSVIATGITDEEGQLFLRPRRKGFYTARISGTSTESGTVRFRRGRRRR